MSFSQSMHQLTRERETRSSAARQNQQSDPDGLDSATRDHYGRRQKFLAEAYRTDWWMVAIAALLLLAGVGFVVL